MKPNAVRTALIAAAALSVVSSAAQAKWWKFGKTYTAQSTQQSTPVTQSSTGTTVTQQATPATQTVQATPATYNQQMTKAQYRQMAYQQWQQKQQKHKLKIHLPFFYMGAF